MKMATLGPCTEFRTCSGVDRAPITSKEFLSNDPAGSLHGFQEGASDPCCGGCLYVLVTWYVSEDASVYMLVRCAWSLTLQLHMLHQHSSFSK